MAQRRHSYAWAHATDVANAETWRLTEAAEKGLEHAAELAEQTRLRSNRNLRSYKPESAATPLTIEMLAAEFGIAPSTVRSRIATARRQLFGNISDAAISKRAQRRRRPIPRPTRPPRTCREQGCDQQLPANVHGNQHYCNQHRTASARTRRHRRLCGR